MSEDCKSWELLYDEVAKPHRAHFAGQQDIRYRYIHLDYEINGYWQSPVLLRVTKAGRTYDAGCQIWVSKASIPNLPSDQPVSGIIRSAPAVAFYWYWFWRGWGQRIKLIALMLALAGLGLEAWLVFIDSPTALGAAELSRQLKLLSFGLKAVGLLLIFTDEFIKRLNPV
jgi:hypothetical protein